MLADPLTGVPAGVLTMVTVTPNKIKQDFSKQNLTTHCYRHNNTMTI